METKNNSYAGFIMIPMRNIITTRLTPTEKLVLFYICADMSVSGYSRIQDSETSKTLSIPLDEVKKIYRKLIVEEFISVEDHNGIDYFTYGNNY